MPYGKPLKDEYFDTFVILAKLCKVKLMWKELLVEGVIIKGISAIGVHDRVLLWIQVVDHLFTYYLSLEAYIKSNLQRESKEHGFTDIRNYSSYLIEIQRDTIYVYLKKLLESDYSYELWLENVIKEQFRLDYKKYNTDKHEYYHAISTSFYPKRMLL
jgi:hypothetical protein